MNDLVLLTSLWLIPLIGVLVVLAIPKRNESWIPRTALAFTIATFAVSLVALENYMNEQAASRPLEDRARDNIVSVAPGGEVTTQEDGTARYDLVVRRSWIPSFNIQYYLGLDGISLSLVVLTGLVSVLACLASWNIEKQVRGYHSLFLVLLASMMGVFIALDLFLFYVFFEVMLLPMYFLIAIWGGENREYAAIKFLLYTLFGSVFILVAVLILYFWPGDMAAAIGGKAYQAHTFDIVLLTRAATETAYYGNVI